MLELSRFQHSVVGVRVQVSKYEGIFFTRLELINTERKLQNLLIYYHPLFIALQFLYLSVYVSGVGGLYATLSGRYLH